MSDVTCGDAERFPILQTARALALMRNALVLLDEVGAGVATPHLQFAIDLLDHSQSNTPEE